MKTSIAADVSELRQDFGCPPVNIVFSHDIPHIPHALGLFGGVHLQGGLQEPGVHPAVAVEREILGREGALHRRAVFLQLPAAERAAVIFDDELVAGHQTSRIGNYARGR